MIYNVEYSSNRHKGSNMCEYLRDLGIALEEVIANCKEYKCRADLYEIPANDCLSKGKILGSVNRKGRYKLLKK